MRFLTLLAVIAGLALQAVALDSSALRFTGLMKVGDETWVGLCNATSAADRRWVHPGGEFNGWKLVALVQGDEAKAILERAGERVELSLQAAPIRGKASTVSADVWAREMYPVNYTLSQVWLANEGKRDHPLPPPPPPPPGMGEGGEKGAGSSAAGSPATAAESQPVSQICATCGVDHSAEIAAAAREAQAATESR